MAGGIVILLVRMWVEISNNIFMLLVFIGHPPCEDVSWNTILRAISSAIDWCHPPCEDVSWNTILRAISSAIDWCHPPCEDVSWNHHIIVIFDVMEVILLVRMWVEIPDHWICQVFRPRHPPCEDVSWNIQKALKLNKKVGSSSLWGCELKSSHNCHFWCHGSHPPCEDVSWNKKGTPTRKERKSHPPCEDVSWNLISYTSFLFPPVILLVRMWVEIHLAL